MMVVFRKKQLKTAWLSKKRKVLKKKVLENAPRNSQDLRTIRRNTSEKLTPRSKPPCVEEEPFQMKNDFQAKTSSRAKLAESLCSMTIVHILPGY